MLKYASTSKGGGTDARALSALLVSSYRSSPDDNDLIHSCPPAIPHHQMVHDPRRHKHRTEVRNLSRRKKDSVRIGMGKLDPTSSARSATEYIAFITDATHSTSPHTQTSNRPNYKSSFETAVSFSFSLTL